VLCRSSPIHTKFDFMNQVDMQRYARLKVRQAPKFGAEQRSYSMLRAIQSLTR
jgi:hypothetical protein